MVNREKMVAFEVAVQEILDRDYGRPKFIATHSYHRPHVHPQEVVCVYTAKDCQEANYKNPLFAISYREWDREFAKTKADLTPIVVERMKESTAKADQPEKVKLWPIQVNSEVIGYGIGEKNANRISHAIYQLRWFFVEDFNEPTVNVKAEIEVEIPKQQGKCDCGKLSVHKIFRGDQTVEMCCRCYVRAGNPPSDWHPECMREAAKKQQGK